MHCLKTSQIRSLSFFKIEPGKPADDRHVQDMLRYDRAFQCPTDPTLIAYVTYKVRGDVAGTKVPTVRRWESFGLKVVIQQERDDVRNDFLAGQWVTYIHPEVPGHGTDYGSLSPITAESWITTMSSR